MEYFVVVALILVVFFYTKLKSLFYKATDNALVKEDEALKDKQKTLEQQIKDTKAELNKPTPGLTPEQVEEFWKDNKK